MVDQKTKVTLEVGVEDRAVVSLRRHIEQAMSAAPVKRLEQAVQRLGQTVNRTGTKMRSMGASAAFTPDADLARARGGGSRDPRTGRFLGAGGAGRGGIGGGGGRPLGFMATAAASGVGHLGAQAVMGAGARAQGVGVAAIGGEGAVERALEGIPIVGPFMAAMVGAARKYGSQAIQFGQAQAGVLGQTGGGLNLGAGSPVARRAQRLGIGRQRLPGMMAQMAQSSAFRDQELGQFAPGALEAQQAFGVNAGALAGAAGTSGGQINPAQAIELTEKAIEAGLMAGFREARLGKFIEQIAGHVEALRSKGIMVDPESTLQMVGVLGRTQKQSLQGAAGLSAVRGMEDVIRGAGQKSDFFSAMAMEAAMQQTGGDAFQAELLLEKDPNAALLGKINAQGGRGGKGSILQKFADMGGKTEGKAKALHHAMGGRLSLQQSFEMIQAAEAGDFAAAARVSGFGGGEAISEELAAQGVGMGKEGATIGKLGIAAKEAREINEDLATGEAVVGKLQKLRQFERGLGRAGAAKGGEIIEKVTQYTDAFEKGGAMGLLEQAGKDLTSIFGNLIDTIEKAFPKLGAKKKTKELASELSGGWDIFKDDMDKILAALTQWMAALANSSVGQFFGFEPPKLAPATGT